MNRPHGGAFSGRLGWGERPVVLVVDLVRAYTEPDGPFALPDPPLTATQTLVEAARTAGVPVLWTVVRYAADLADAGLFVRKVPALAAFAEGAPGDWDALALTPALGETVVVKQYASAFAGTSLAATLTALGADSVLVAGVSTSGCVRATATDCLQHGLRALVVRQACADRDPALHERNLTDLDAKYADVVDLDDVLTHLS
ncbi:isochorismatase family protein [Pseudonocardia halophobica]|uniref:isochorismatase family protein n=1 Tax=Pseudonocardia halophobica TaxID=29401 RepID=UPI003D90CC7F